MISLKTEGVTPPTPDLEVVAKAIPQINEVEGPSRG